ncbi:MAG: DUF1566 domain-containing protein [Desulfobacteraceae bacterium]|nr:DUF1566 domain-containing protein [Desulfobacteraceae bacterium]
MLKSSVLAILAGLTFVCSHTAILAGPVPDTGQTQSYTNTFGEDSDYTINPPSYTKLDDQGNDLPNSATEWVMVRDNVTGLVWEVKTDDGSIHDKDYKYTWYDSNPQTNGGNAGTPGNGTDTEDFIQVLNNANLGGFSDWRLPTVKELVSIVNRGVYDPAINTDYFPNTNTESPSRYWSSTTLSFAANTAYCVIFIDGGVVPNGKDCLYYVRAVRGGQPVSSGNLVDNGNGMVTDTSTGLMWQQATAGEMDWESAISYCENLSLAGHNDWRLPNIKELHSIVDYSKWRPTIDTLYFPNTVSSHYWSATTNSSLTHIAFGVYFEYGGIGNTSKYTTNYVRAVRGGEPSITMTYPNGGEEFVEGTTHTITWDSEGEIYFVRIEFSAENGAKWFEISANEENDGSYLWDVPYDLSDQCLLRISDVDGDPSDVNDAPFSIIRGNQSPIADAGGSYTVDEGTSLSLDGSGSYDPDGDVLSFAWDLDNDGQYDDSTDPVTIYTWYDDGTYTVGLKVSDSVLEDTDTATVAVSNVAPTVEAGEDQTAIENQSVNFNGSFTDPGADTHTIEWDFGDAQGDSGNLNISHVYSQEGIYTVTLTVTDDDGGVGSDSLTIEVISTQDAITQILQEARSVINGLDDSVFKRKQMRNRLNRKINSVLRLIDKRRYQRALDKLEYGILTKMDGCAETDSPDKNDWIIDCDAQKQVYPLIVEAIALLRTLV